MSWNGARTLIPYTLGFEPRDEHELSRADSCRDRSPSPNTTTDHSHDKHRFVLKWLRNTYTHMRNTHMRICGRKHDTRNRVFDVLDKYLFVSLAL